MEQLNKYFDHTNLKPEAKEKDIKKLCKEAIKYDFFAVCVSGCHVPLAVSILKDTNVKVATVVGFPFGTMTTSAKAFEADEACENGAEEIDMVINVGALKDGRYDYVRDEIAVICTMANEHGAIVKVILETWLLTDAEIKKGCQLAMEAGAAFIKTSTGVTKGATPHSVALIKDTVGDQMKIKASGGIRDILTVKEMLRLGADRIGASSSVSIMDASR